MNKICHRWISFPGKQSCVLICKIPPSKIFLKGKVVIITALDFDLLFVGTKIG